MEPSPHGDIIAAMRRVATSARNVITSLLAGRDLQRARRALATSAQRARCQTQRHFSVTSRYTRTSISRSFLNKSTMFDIEKFILEVKERPALYDVQLAEYRNREIKAKYWYDVGSAMFTEWDDLTSKEKKKKVSVQYYYYKVNIFNF